MSAPDCLAAAAGEHHLSPMSASPSPPSRSWLLTSQAFSVFDLNANGFLNFEELLKLLEYLGLGSELQSPEVDGLLTLLERPPAGSGQVDLDSFVEFLTNENLDSVGCFSLGFTPRSLAARVVLPLCVPTAARRGVPLRRRARWRWGGYADRAGVQRSRRPSPL